MLYIYDNRQLTGDSHEIAYLIFSWLGNMSHIVSSVAVVIGALGVMMSLETSNKQHMYIIVKHNVCQLEVY